MSGSSQPQDTCGAGEVILEKIVNIQKDVSEIKTEVGCLSKNYEAFQRQYIKENAELSMKAVSAHRRLDLHEQRMKAIENQMKEIRDALHPLIFTNKILAFIGSALGLSLIALIWSLITGKAVMVIP